MPRLDIGFSSVWERRCDYPSQELQLGQSIVPPTYYEEPCLSIKETRRLASSTMRGHQSRSSQQHIKAYSRLRHYSPTSNTLPPNHQQRWLRPLIRPQPFGFAANADGLPMWRPRSSASTSTAGTDSLASTAARRRTTSPPATKAGGAVRRSAILGRQRTMAADDAVPTSHMTRAERRGPSLPWKPSSLGRRRPALAVLSASRRQELRASSFLSPLHCFRAFGCERGALLSLGSVTYNGGTAGRVASGGGFFGRWALLVLNFSYLCYCTCMLRRHMVLARFFGSHRPLNMTPGGGGACLHFGGLAYVRWRFG
ncbi:hypothetical protein B0I37DRAFT_53961 [Chaetomium sp. MPI-CAGE-AT-0009]|nr:hypothetical protein B0I37DRAFT_53961 [Chaetomium sp. MPI-CAGE-AT-0009]